MTDPTTDPASSNPDSSDPAGKDQLIESIYRIALEPQTYDTFMGHWDEYISQRLGALETLQAAPETLNETERYPEIASHFEIASRLLEQMEHKAPGLSEPQQSGTSEPQFLIDASGRIIWFNSAASTAFNLSKTSTIDSLDLPELQADGLAKMSASLLSPGAQTAPLILKLNSADPASRPHYLYARVLPEQQGEDIILVSKVTPDWPPEIDALLTSGFNLSKSEIDICALIADGQGAAQIAEIRTSALATVRTQIKRIMAKTSCSTQSELVRLLHSVMRVAEDNAKSQPPAHLSPERTLYVNLPDRVMPVEQFGDPNGAPVIFFHGMLDGNTMTHEAQALLRLHKLRLICPVRPWFGAAAGTGIPVADAPEAFARDVLEMIAQLQLQAPVLLGHMAGAVYAYAAATAAASAAPAGHPARDIKGIVIVSGGVPIVSLSQFSTMSTRQRLVAYTARFTPKMLPFVVRAGISQMESGGSKTFMRSLYETAPHDLALVADPEIASIIFAGYRFTVQQGHRAFEIDSFHVVSNWSHWLDGNTVPIRVLHGRTDPVVSLPSVETCYASRAERAKLEVLEESGQLIFYQHPDKVIDAILDIMAHPQA